MYGDVNRKPVCYFFTSRIACHLRPDAKGSPCLEAFTDSVHEGVASQVIKYCNNWNNANTFLAVVIPRNSKYYWNTCSSLITSSYVGEDQIQFSSNRCQINLDNLDTPKILAEMADLRTIINICREIISRLAKSVLLHRQRAIPFCWTWAEKWSRALPGYGTKDSAGATVDRSGPYCVAKRIQIAHQKFSSIVLGMVYSWTSLTQLVFLALQFGF